MHKMRQRLFVWWGMIKFLNCKKIIKEKNGMTLVEVLVSLFSIAIIFFGVINLLIMTLNITADNKYRMASLMIAEQHMEQVRNMPYDDIGIIGSGIPGILPATTTITNNNGTYYIENYVEFVDDAFDGLGAGDPNPADYKNIGIKVEWHGPLGVKSVNTFSKVAPRGLEGTSGGGTLSILVVNANGDPIDNASTTVRFIPPDTTAEYLTNASGLVEVYGASSSINAYEIIVTKQGYSLSSTTAITVENPFPTQPNATVNEGAKTEVTFLIDLLSNLTINTIEADLPENWVGSSDTATDGQLNSRIAIDSSSGDKFVVWQDTRPGNMKVMGQRYDNTNNSVWGDDENIASANGTVLPDINLNETGTHLYVTWAEATSTGVNKIYIAKHEATTGNVSWGATKVSSVNTTQSAPRLTLITSGGVTNTTIIWEDERNTHLDVYIEQFDDNGNKLDFETIVNTDGTGFNQYSPVITHYSTTTIFTAWTDGRNGDYDIYAKKFTSSLSPIWEKQIASSSVGVDQYSPTIDTDDSGNFYVAWTDERNGDRDIYMQKYDTDGSKLWSPDLLINTNSDLTNQTEPSLAVDKTGGFIYITWTDERNGDKDIYAQKIDLTGTHIWTNDVRVNISTSTSNEYKSDVYIDTFPNPNVPYVTWTSDGDGDDDILISSINEYTGINPLSSIPITITGSKKIGESPIIYKYLVHATSTAGKVDLTNIEWDSYTVTLRSGYTGYSIELIDPNSPYALSPNTTSELNLYLK